MPDWNKYKVQDLQSELKQRSLPVSGKKPELIARLQEYESKNSSAKPAAPAAPTAPATSAAPTPAAPTPAAVAPTSTLPAEDDIDWLDEDIPTTATAPPATSAASVPAPAKSTSATSAASSAEKETSAPAAAAIAAGGLGQVPNPTAVPNQKIDTDPSTTSDLTVKGDAAIPSEKPAEIIAASGESTKPAEPKKSAEPEEEKEPAPAKDFTSGLAKTELEKELEAHKARAKKFGGNVEEASTAVVNALEREKKVGAGEAGSVLSKLDQPLAERGPRKRGRGNIPGEEAGRERGGKRRQVNQRGRGGGERPRRGERQRNGGGHDGGGAAGGAVKPAMVSEADKKKAQERKEKFEREAKKMGAGA